MTRIPIPEPGADGWTRASFEFVAERVHASLDELERARVMCDELLAAPASATGAGIAGGMVVSAMASLRALQRALHKGMHPARAEAARAAAHNGRHR